MSRHALFFVLAWGLVSVTADVDYGSDDLAMVADEPSVVTATLPASDLGMDTADVAGATRQRREPIYARADWPFDQQLPSFIQNFAKLPWFNVPWYHISPQSQPAPATVAAPALAPAPPALQSDVSALQRAVLELHATVDRLHRRQQALLSVLRCASTKTPSCSRSYVSDRRAQGVVSTQEADDLDWLLSGLPAAAPPASVPLPVAPFPTEDQRAGFPAPPYPGYGPGQGYGPGFGLNQGYGVGPGQGYGPGPGFGAGQGYGPGQGFGQGFNPGQGYGYGQGFSVPQVNPNAYQQNFLPNRSGAGNQSPNTVNLPIPNGVANPAANAGSPVYQGTSTSASSLSGPGGATFSSTSEQTSVDASGKQTVSSVTASGDSAGHVAVTTSGNDLKTKT